MYQILSNIAMAILAYLAGKAKQNDKAKAEFNKIALKYREDLLEIERMDDAAIAAELAERMQPVKRNQSN